jgi:hypothetical protein
LWIMKRIFYLLSGAFLLSFSNKTDEEPLDGIWMGAYESENTMENVVVKLGDKNQLEFYQGDLDEKNKVIGTYHLQGDSVTISYKTTDGKEFNLTGHVNYRKTFVDGKWVANDKAKGNFYLQKQKFREMLAQP